VATTRKCCCDLPMAPSLCSRVFLSDRFEDETQSHRHMPSNHPTTRSSCWSHDGDPVVARYSWSQDDGAQSGRMVLHERAGLIERLIVTFEREG